MKGNIEKIEQDEYEIIKCGNKALKEYIELIELKEKQERLKKMLKENRECLLVWQSKEAFGIKECNSEEQAYNYIKLYNATYYKIIDGYAYRGNWNLNTAYSRR